MSNDYTPYATGRRPDATDRATQIRHLALLGLAATESARNIRDVGRCQVSLFEVIARLADEIENEANP